MLNTSVFPGRKISATIFIFLFVVSDGFCIGVEKADKLDNAINLKNSKQYAAAYSLLKEIKATSAYEGQKATVELLMGQTAGELKRSDESLQHFASARAANSRLSDVAFYEEGKVFRSIQRPLDAQKAFEAALQLSPSQMLITELYFQMGSMALETQDFKKALTHYSKLERLSRNTERHAEVLWNLIRVEKKSGRQHKSCQWARQLYAKYPAHPLTYDWGLDLNKNKVSGEVTGCLATPDDQKKRIKRLQMAGDTDKALNEIKLLQSRASASTVYHVESMLADFYIGEGLVEEALKILLKHYKTQNNNYGYLSLIAKAAARSNEFQVAVAAYHRAAEVAKKSAAGRKALFQSAFLSYQFQDYDGAGRKFEEFIKKYSTSGLTRDAKWHLAWIRYLKGDYVGADVALATLQGLRRKNPRAWRSFSPDRLDYWRAMTLMKLGQAQEARALFESIAKDPLHDYYGVAAEQRLQQLKGSSRGVASTKSHASQVKDLSVGLDTGPNTGLNTGSNTGPNTGSNTVIKGSLTGGKTASNTGSTAGHSIGPVNGPTIGPAKGSSTELNAALTSASGKATMPGLIPSLVVAASPDKIALTAAKNTPTSLEAAIHSHVESLSGLNAKPSSNLIAMNPTKPVPPEDESEDLLATDQASDSDGEEDSSVGDATQADVPVAEGVIAGASVENDVAPIEDRVRVTEFKDPKLALRFERARELNRIGLKDWARSELLEIERKTSNSDYRKTLMSEFQNVDAFNRSSYIGSIYFSGQRAQHGINGIRYLWEYAYPKAYENLVQLYSRSNGIPKELIWGIIRAETQYRKEAVSPVGAMGLMQIMPNTGRQLAKLSSFSGFQVGSLLEPDISIRLGSKYLARLMKMFKDKVPLTAAAYNAGPHRVQAWLYNFGNLDMDEFVEHIPFLETRNYVKRVVSFFYTYQTLYGSDKPNLSWLAQPVNVRLSMPPPTKETWEPL